MIVAAVAAAIAVAAAVAAAIAVAAAVAATAIHAIAVVGIVVGVVTVVGAATSVTASNLASLGFRIDGGVCRVFRCRMQVRRRDRGRRCVRVALPVPVAWRIRKYSII